MNYSNNNGVDPYKARKRDKRFSTAVGNEITTNMVKPSGGFQRKSCCNNRNFSNADNDNYSSKLVSGEETITTSKPVDLIHCRRCI